MKYKKRTSTGLIIIALLVLWFLVRPYYLFLTKTVKISPLKTIFSQNSIKKVNNQVNILILGIPGGEHDGPNLSDSIIVVNYDFKKNRALTISIPRDVWSDTLRDKINSAYAYGESKFKGGGIKLAKAEVSAIAGLPIQYGAVINFSDFKTLIDDVGGIDVEVERSFTDKKFPIEGREEDLCDGDPEYNCRYETISFKKGKQRMNGETALKFVRSRNAEGSEGSDFARGRRQQQVIGSLKTELIDVAKSFNLARINKLYSTMDSLVSRDTTNQQAAILLKRVLFKKGFYQKNFYLTDALFEVPDYRLYDGKYVLIPKNDDFDSIHKIVTCLLEKEDEKLCLKSENE